MAFVWRSVSLLTLLCFTSLVMAGESKRPITKPKFDPDARQVELFTAIERSELEVTMRPKNEFGGNVFLRNVTDKPITVLLPDAIVGLHVHPQFGGGAIGGAGGGLGGQGAGGLGGGQNQAIGGGLGGGGFGGGGGGGFGGQQGGGGGFFSIPAAETVRIPFQSVCLEHGKHSPTARNTYKVVPVEQYSDKPELKALCIAVGSGQVDRAVAQAAAWHISSGMTWDQLAAKTFDRAAAADTPYFSYAQLVAARNLVQAASAHARRQPALSGQIQSASPSAR